MPDWKPHIRTRLASLPLEPTREAAIGKEPALKLAFQVPTPKNK